MGGFSLTLRGSERATYDVDIAVGCNMQQLVQVISAQPRILRPLGPVAGALRIFVKTGGEGNPLVPELWTMVDLILRGSLGAPNEPESASEVVTVNTGNGEKRYPVLWRDVQVWYEYRQLLSLQAPGQGCKFQVEALEFGVAATFW